MRKGRVVVDVHSLNESTASGSYLLPLRLNIASLVVGYEWITVVDARGYLHQFKVGEATCTSYAFVSHRGREKSTVALIFEQMKTRHQRELTTKDRWQSELSTIP